MEAQSYYGAGLSQTENYPGNYHYDRRAFAIKNTKQRLIYTLNGRRELKFIKFNAISIYDRKVVKLRMH